MPFDSDWARKAVEAALELESKASEETSGILKKSMDITFGPGAFIGGAIGAALGGSKKEQELKQQYGNAVQKAINENNKKLADMGTTYYAQVENMTKDLKVMFSPITVVFLLHGTVIDTISTAEMNPRMKEAFREKDSGYFNNYYLNKVKLDAHLAESYYAQKLLETKASITNALLNKEASEVNLEPLSMRREVASFRATLAKTAGNKALDALSALILTKFAQSKETQSDITLEGIYRTKENDLDLGYTKLAFFGFGEDSNISTHDVHKDLAVSFLPDRVLYIHKNIVLHQMPVTDMDEGMYDKFSDRDDDYFRSNFLDNLKKAGLEDEGLEVTAGSNPGVHTLTLDSLIQEPSAPEPLPNTTESTQENEDTTTSNAEYKKKRMALEAVDSALDAARATGVIRLLNKAAAVGDINALYKELLGNDECHPKTLYLLLMNKFNDEWLDWDIAFLLQECRSTFGVPISEVNENKIMFIRTLMSSQSPLTGYHAFEKLVRTFNGMKIDFQERESNISLSDIVFAIRTAGEIIGDTTGAVYNNISEHVMGYITEVLFTSNDRVCAQNMLNAIEESFWTLVNMELTDLWNDHMVVNLSDTEQVEAMHRMNRIISKLSIEIASGEDKVNVEELKQRIHGRCEDLGSTSEFIESAILENVVSGIVVNIYWEYKEDQLAEEIKKYL